MLVEEDERTLGGVAPQGMLQSPCSGLAAEFFFLRSGGVSGFLLSFSSNSSDDFSANFPGPFLWKSPPIYRLLVAIRWVYEHLIY